MVNLAGLSSFVSELRVMRRILADEIRRVDAAITVLGKIGGGSNHTKPGRSISAAARRKISLAQKKRWARVKAGNVVSIAPKRGKRKLSAAGRRRIGAAQRARWAKFRAKKTA
jgi:hypothetical protein